jgi:autotransporter-associated beta strand protein
MSLLRPQIVVVLAVGSASGTLWAQTSATWNVNANGVWATGSNWTPATAPGNGGTATFGSVITAPRTVSINSGVTVGTIVFDNLNPYTLAGSASLTLAGSRTIDVRSGQHFIERPILGSGGLNKIGPGTLELRAPNSIAGNLAVQGGSLRLAPGWTPAMPGSAGVAVASATLELAAGTDFGSRTLGLLPGSTLRTTGGSTRFAGTTFLAGNAVTLDVGAGSSLELAGDWVAASGTAVIKSGPGELRVKRLGPGSASTQAVESLSVANGTVRLLERSEGGASGAVAALTLSSGASVDLRDNALVIDYDTSSPVASVVGWLASGALSTSSSGLALGYIESAERFGAFPAAFDGVAVDATSLIVAAVRPGDTNLDGAVEFEDLLRVAQNYEQPGGWSQGDFDYNGTVGFSDLLSLAQNYGTGGLAGGSEGAGVARFWMDWQNARSVVPEPVGAAVMSLSVVGFALIRRQGRRRGAKCKNSLA